MRQVPLGNSGLTASAIGYGTYHLREKLGGSDAIDSLAKAFDAGVTFFDTSDNYGTEELIGLAVAEGALPREEIVIATKTGLATSAEEHLGWTREGKTSDTSPARIRKQVDKSLRMLGREVDVIDVYQLHVHDPVTSPDEVCATMDALIAEGKIRTWGVSNHEASELSALLAASDTQKTARPVTSQPFLNVINGVGNDAVSAVSEELTVLAHSPVLKGILVDEIVDQLDVAARADTRAEMQSFIQGISALVELQQYAKSRDLSLAQFAIAWAANMPSTVVLSACTNDQYLQDALRGAACTLDVMDPELLAIQQKFTELNFANIAANIMRSTKIYYR